MFITCHIKSLLTDKHPSIEDSYRKQHHVDGEIAMMEILDTAGYAFNILSLVWRVIYAISSSQEEFSAMRDQWFRQGDAFIILYSIAVRTTFEEVQYVDVILFLLLGFFFFFC